MALQGIPLSVPLALSCLRGDAGPSTLAQGVPHLWGEEAVAHQPAEEEGALQPLADGSEPDWLRGAGG